MIRQLLVLAICIVTAAHPAAFARDAHAEMRPPTPEDTATYFHSMDQLMTRSAASGRPGMFDPKEIRRRIAEGARTALTAPAAALPHMAQTLTLLWILGGVEAVRQDHQFDPLRVQKTSKIGLIANVGDQLINSFSLFTGMGGGSATGALLAKPVSALNQLIMSNVTRPMLQNLLVSGAGSFVTFVGWEAGAKMWEEAMMLLPVEDIRIAKDLRFTEIMSGRGTEEQNRVFKALASNAYDILTWANPEVSNTWLYNTWRHRIATGEFVTMLTSMVVAGTVAGSLAPGAGTVVGFCFGVVGGLLGGTIAIFLPRSAKQPITDGLRRMRIQNAEGKLKTIDMYMERALKRPGTSLAYKENIMREYLTYRTYARNDLVTVYFEQIYDANLRLQEADTVLKLIHANPGKCTLGSVTDNFLVAAPVIDSTNPDVMNLEKKFTEQFKESNERVQFYFREAVEVQKAEVKSLAQIAYLDTIPDSIGEMLQATIKDLTTVHMALRHVFVGLQPAMKTEMALENLNAEDLKKLPVSSLILLNLFYLRSFEEASFLDP